MIRNWETHGFHHFYDPITDFCIIFKAMICRNTVRLRWTKLFFLFFWFLGRCPSYSWRNQLTTARKLSFLKCFWLNTHEKTRFLHNILLQKYPCVVHISCTIHCKRDITFLNACEKKTFGFWSCAHVVRSCTYDWQRSSATRLAPFPCPNPQSCSPAPIRTH